MRGECHKGVRDVITRLKLKIIFQDLRFWLEQKPPPDLPTSKYCTLVMSDNVIIKDKLFFKNSKLSNAVQSFSTEILTSCFQ